MENLLTFLQTLGLDVGLDKIQTKLEKKGLDPKS